MSVAERQTTTTLNSSTLFFFTVIITLSQFCWMSDEDNFLLHQHFIAMYPSFNTKRSTVYVRTCATMNQGGEEAFDLPEFVVSKSVMSKLVLPKSVIPKSNVANVAVVVSSLVLGGAAIAKLIASSCLIRGRFCMMSPEKQVVTWLVLVASGLLFDAAFKELSTPLIVGNEREEDMCVMPANEDKVCTFVTPVNDAALVAADLLFVAASVLLFVAALVASGILFVASFIIGNEREEEMFVIPSNEEKARKFVMPENERKARNFYMPSNEKKARNWLEAVRHETLEGCEHSPFLILRVLDVYPQCEDVGIPILIKANVHLGELKEALRYYNDTKENKLRHPLGQALLCCPDETLLYIADAFPNADNWNYGTMFCNSLDRHDNGLKPVSLKTWKQLFSRIVDKDNQLEAINAAMACNTSKSVSGLLLEMACPKVIVTLYIPKKGSYVNETLLGQSLPRIQRLGLTDEVAFKKRGEINFWSSLPAQGQLKVLEFDLHINQVLDNLEFQTVLKNALSNNRSLENLCLHVAADKRFVFTKNDFGKLFKLIGESIQHMPQLDTLHLTRQVVSATSILRIFSCSYCRKTRF